MTTLDAEALDLFREVNILIADFFRGSVVNSYWQMDARIQGRAEKHQGQTAVRIVPNASRE